MKTIMVKCQFTLPIEVPDDEDYDPYFDIEENSCPGTGKVWIALRKIIEECDKENVCWACKLNGTNTIVDMS